VSTAFGKDVVEHYALMARADWDAYTRAAVTDWEIDRAFEQA
jgi:glutamine synthetase